MLSGKKDYWILGALIAILAFFVFLRPFYGWGLRSFFEPQVGARAETDFRMENEKLKSEIARLNLIKSQVSERLSGYFTAMVYSRYPFNFKNELLVNVGEKDGIAVGRPVLFRDVLVGRTIKVFSDSALIQTVFDDGFQLSVGIGNSGVRALFKGGSLPKLSLIPLSGSIGQGDVVYSVSPDFPYGVPIGEVGAVSLGNDHLFREASLKFSYDLNEVKAVLVKMARK